MKYTVSEKVDIDKIKEEVSKKGFSDRVKKYIGSVLLAAQITGVSPALAGNLNTVQSDSQSNIIEFQDDTITVESMKKEFRSLLENSTLSDEQKRIMLKNLNENFVELEINEGLREKENASGQYLCMEKKIYLDAEVGLDTKIHEMTHVASTNRVLGELKNIGMIAKRKGDYFDIRRIFNSEYGWYGLGFNEGMTEYLADKIIKENGIEPEDTTYPSLVVATNDIIGLYGEETVIDAYLGAPERLEELMAKDGKHLTQFLELMDQQYKMEYDERYYSSNNNLKKTYKAIVDFIKDIREKRLKENPNVILPEFESEEIIKYMDGTLIKVKDFSEEYGFNNITDDLSFLYGEDVIMDAGSFNDDELRDLMKKDGYDWDAFYKKFKEYALFVDNSKRYEGYEGIVDKKRQKFLEIGKIIEDMKKKKIQENPEIDMPESKWKEFYISNFGGKIEDIERNIASNIPVEKKSQNRFFAWIKNLKDKITGKFKKKDEVLLLNSGDEKIESNESKRNEFLDSIKVDESELIYNQPTKDEEIGKGEVNKENTEMER